MSEEGKQASGKLGPIQPNKAKRTHSEVANSSAEDIALIMLELEEMKDDLRKTAKSAEIKEIVLTAVKELLENTKTDILEKLEKNIKPVEKRIEVIENKLKNYSKLQDHVDALNLENENLKEKLSELSKQNKKLSEATKSATYLSQEAMKKANQNEQYSRKNNIKILGVPEKKDENTQETVIKVLQEVADYNLSNANIVAVHRIPGKQGKPRPIIIKFVNSDIKAQVIRKRKMVRERGRGIKLTDDVTLLNSKLINRLYDHEKIESAWYYNGAVFGSDGQRRYKFDIYDDIDQRLRK